MVGPRKDQAPHAYKTVQLIFIRIQLWALHKNYFYISIIGKFPPPIISPPPINQEVSATGYILFKNFSVPFLWIRHLPSKLSSCVPALTCACDSVFELLPFIHLFPRVISKPPDLTLPVPCFIRI